MIYVIDHKDSFTHNVVHQLSLFDEVECDNYNNVDKIKLNKADNKTVKSLFLITFLYNIVNWIDFCISKNLTLDQLTFWSNEFITRF